MTVEFGRWLKARVDERGISQSKIAELGGIANSGLSMVLNGRREPTPRFCVRVAEPLGISPFRIMQKAGLIQDGDVSQMDAYYIGNTVTREELVLLNYFRGMNAQGRETILALARAMPLVEEAATERQSPPRLETAA
jgi:transcriptional regulator with XRE-family HTH domain